MNWSDEYNISNRFYSSINGLHMIKKKGLIISTVLSSIYHFLLHAKSAHIVEWHHTILSFYRRLHWSQEYNIHCGFPMKYNKNFYTFKTVTQNRSRWEKINSRTCNLKTKQVCSLCMTNCNYSFFNVKLLINLYL